MPYLDKLRRDVEELKNNLEEEPDFFSTTRWPITIRITAYKNQS